MNQLLSDVNIALGSLDAMSHLLPNVDHAIAMHVHKEALFSPQIEETQASLDDVFAYAKSPIHQKRSRYRRGNIVI